jgi:hypothetical protein
MALLTRALTSAVTMAIVRRRSLLITGSSLVTRGGVDFASRKIGQVCWNRA